MLKFIAKLFSPVTANPTLKARLCVEGMEDRATPAGLPNPGDTVLIAHWNPPTVALGNGALVTVVAHTTGGIGVQNPGGTVQITIEPTAPGAIATHGFVIVGG